MISFKQKGDFSKTYEFLNRARDGISKSKLEKYGKEGVEALQLATPKDTGKTAYSWEYRINKSGKKITLSWHNTNINDGVSVAILLQYGHVNNGVYVRGIDYINPALKPIFDRMANELWKEITRT